MTRDLVTDADIASFERDGVACLRQVFSERWVELL